MSLMTLRPLTPPVAIGIVVVIIIIIIIIISIVNTINHMPSNHHSSLNRRHVDHNGAG